MKVGRVFGVDLFHSLMAAEGRAVAQTFVKSGMNGDELICGSRDMRQGDMRVLRWQERRMCHYHVLNNWHRPPPQNRWIHFTCQAYLGSRQRESCPRISGVASWDHKETDAGQIFKR